MDLAGSVINVEMRAASINGAIAELNFYFFIWFCCSKNMLTSIESHQCVKPLSHVHTFRHVFIGIYCCLCTASYRMVFKTRLSSTEVSQGTKQSDVGNIMIKITMIK